MAAIKTKDIIDSSEVSKELQVVINKMNDLIEAMNKTQSSIKKGNTSRKQMTAAQKEAAEQAKEQVRLEKELAKAQKATDKKMAEIANQRKKESNQRIKDAQKQAAAVEKAAQKQAEAEAKAAQKIVAKRQKQEAAIAKERQQRLELINASRMEIKSDADLNAKLAAQRKLRTQLDRSTAKGEAQYRKMTTSIQHMAAAQDKANRSQKVFGHNVGNYPNQMGKATTSTQKFSAGLAGVAVAAAAAVMAFRQVGRYVVDVVNTFAEFDQTQAKLKTISGATAEEMLTLRNSAKEIGATTEKSAQQVSQLQLELSKLGFSATEIDEATGSIVNLSIATGEDLAESATTVAGVLNALNLDASESSRVADVMASSFSNSALDLNKFKDGMSKFAPVANQLNWSLEETTSRLAILADNNIDAGTASAQLRNVMLELNARGLTLDEVLLKLNGSTNLLADANDMFGKRAAPVVAVLAENIDKSKELEQTFLSAKGAADDMGAIMADNLSGDIDKAKSSIEGLKISIGEGENDGLRGSVQGFTKAVDWLAKSEFFGKYLGMWKKQIVALFEPFKSMFDVFADIAEMLGFATNKSDALTMAMDGLFTIAKIVQLPFKALAKTFQNYFNTIKFLIDIISGKKGLDQVFRQLKQTILNALSPITDILVDLGVLKEQADSTAKGIGGVSSELNRMKQEAKDAAGIVDEVAESWNNVTGAIGKFNHVNEKKQALLDKHNEQLKIEKEKVEELNKAYEDYLKKIAELNRNYELNDQFLKSEKDKKDAKIKLDQDIFDASLDYYKKVTPEMQKMIDNYSIIIEQGKMMQSTGSMQIVNDRDLSLIKEAQTETKSLFDIMAETRKLVEDGYNDSQKTIFDKLTEGAAKFGEFWDKNGEAIVTSVNAISDAIGAHYDNQITGIEAVEEKNNAYYDGRIALYEDDEAAVKQLEDQKAAAAEETQARILEIQRKQAIADKAKAIFDIAINTATGIIKALASENLILAAAIGVAGAVQTGVVASTPLPQYRFGLDYAQTEHDAIVGDDPSGKPERVNYPDGSFALFNKPTAITLPVGSSVDTAMETELNFRKMQFTANIDKLHEDSAKQLQLLSVIAKNTGRREKRVSDRDIMYLTKIRK